MQIATSTSVPHAAASGAQHLNPVAADSGTNPLAHYQIIRRNGAVVPFEPNKIAIAMMKAFLAVHGTQGAASASVRETVDGLTQAVIRALVRPWAPSNGAGSKRRKGLEVKRMKRMKEAASNPCTPKAALVSRSPPRCKRATSPA